MISVIKRLLSFTFIGAIFLLIPSGLSAQETGSSNIIGPAKLKAINTIKSDLSKRFCGNKVFPDCPNIGNIERNEIRSQINWFGVMASSEADKITSEPTGTIQEKTAAGSKFIIALYDNFLANLESRKSNISGANSDRILSVINISIEITNINKQKESLVVDYNTGAVTATQLGNDVQNLDNQKKTVQGASPDECNLIISPWTCVNQVVSWILRVTVVNLSLFIFYTCSVFLHFTISFGLTSMKTLITEDVYTLWLFTRNLVLAACLFATLYFAGMYMLGLGSVIARPTAAVILFTIFSGFSFTLSTYLIDGSTLITTSLYNTIDPEWSNPKTFEAPTIGTKFFKYLGYQSVSSFLTGAPDKNSILEKIGSGSNLFEGVALNLLVAATMLYNSFVIAMMGILFLVRDIGLLVCVIFSPLLLIDQAIPKLSEWAKWLRKFFVGQLVLGPVFMFLMYIAFAITEVISKGTASLGIQSGRNSGGLILFNIVAISLIFHYTYKTCKSLGGVLAEASLGALGGLASKAMIATPLGAAARVASFAGKNTVGRAARHLSREGGMLEGSKIANYAANDASYDFRASKTFANADKLFQQKTGFSTSNSFVDTGVSYATAKVNLKKDLEETNAITNEERREKLMGRKLRSFGAANLDFSTKKGSTLNELREGANSSRKKKLTSAFTDQITSLNFDDLTSKKPEEVQNIKDSLKKLADKAEATGNKDMQKLVRDLIQKRVLSGLTDKVREGEPIINELGTPVIMDPLDVNFKAKMKIIIESRAKTLDKDMPWKDLPGQETTTMAGSLKTGKMENIFGSQLDQIIGAKKKELLNAQKSGYFGQIDAEGKIRRVTTAQNNPRHSSTSAEPIDFDKLAEDSGLSLVTKEGDVAANDSQGKFNEVLNDDIASFIASSGLILATASGGKVRERVRIARNEIEPEHLEIQA